MHIKGYSLILMIEMNICYRYGSIFWKTACLTVNAGLLGEEQSGTDYGAIAKAIGDMKGLILPPDINLSDKGFTPLERENKILFGLKPISGLGTDTLEAIIENRPYSSFDDFFNKLVSTKKISEAKGVTLIKSGVFDCFEPDRKKLMVEYVRRITPKRTKLTMVQLESMINYIDQEKYKEELEIWSFRKKIFGRNKVLMTKDIEQEFIKNYSAHVSYSFEDGSLKIDEKSFDKYYKAKTETLKEWLNEQTTIDLFNKMKMQEFWRNNCLGNRESWEMETNLFYSKNHEMDFMPLNKYFSIANFEDLPSTPIPVSYKMSRGREIPQYKIDVISGTVVDKNKTKSLISILTQNSGVVTLRIPKGSYAHYDQKVVHIDGKTKTILDDSWFNRGTHLVCVGFRREDEFVLRKTGSQFSHTLMKINGYNNEQIALQLEKVAN